jgi:hypothetical protein
MDCGLLLLRGKKHRDETTKLMHREESALGSSCRMFTSSRSC